MGLFTKPYTPPTLDQLHLEAHNLGAKALNVFESLAADLSAAADQHSYVAVEAQDQIDRLVALREAADAAAQAKARKAAAIASLLA